MKDVRVLGTGCAKCRSTVALIEDVARQVGAEIELTKVEEMSEIVSHGVMSTPAVVVDGKVVHSGGIPSREAIVGWLGKRSASA